MDTPPRTKLKQFPPPPSSAAIPSATSTSSSSSFLRAFSGSSKVQDVDVFFEQARTTTDALEGQYKNLVGVIERLVKAEKAYAAATFEVGLRLQALSKEETEPLSTSLKKLSKVFTSLEHIHNSNASYHASTLTDEATHLLKSTQVAQHALNHRTNTLESYNSACRNTQKKITAIERLKSSSSIKPEKVEMALRELEESKKAEAVERDALRGVSEGLKGRVVGWEEEMDGDLGKWVNGYARWEMGVSRAVGGVVSERI
ncbi:Vacuolar protein sorting-associated protein 17 [Chytridiales sp. JEL 0842]|nr:Vacuolar protein sorting-associated protein 17 [Chytridiales sp. JEL 0842]